MPSDLHGKSSHRLQKIIAEAGLASRREAEKWIAAGRVQVNGKVIREQGTKVDPSRDKVAVDGRPIKPTQSKAYYLFYKPKNVMVTRSDPQGRPTIYDYLKKIPERLFPVGRLDFDSEGLLLLTNDGELANQMMHPRSKVPKVYEVEVDRLPTAEEQAKLKSGIILEEGLARMKEVSVIKKGPSAPQTLGIVLTQGKRRQIRRMLAEVGISVRRLVRVAIGPYSLGRLRPGEYRFCHV